MEVLTWMAPKAKETILVVHGTFDKPEPDDSPKWYEPGGAFCEALDRELEAIGSPLRCWAHCRAPSEMFSWSGANHWVERATAARALADYIIARRHEGWGCHVIAHSHGGNVAFEGIKLAVAEMLREANWSGIAPRIQHFPGFVITLGTPFFSPHAPNMMAGRLGPGENLLRTLAEAPAVLAVVALLAAVAYLAMPTTTFGWIASGVAMTLTLLALALLRLLTEMPRGPWGGIHEREERCLVMTSDRDEAFLLLSRISTLEDPFATPRPDGHRQEWRAAQQSLAREIEDIRFPKVESPWEGILVLALRVLFCCILFVAATAAVAYLFVGLRAQFASLLLEATRSAALTLTFSLALLLVLFAGPALERMWTAPVRAANRWRLYVGAYLAEAGVNVIRRFAWRYVRASVSGFSGYQFNSPVVSQTPANADSYCVVERLPEEIETAAITAREGFAAQGTTDLFKILADPTARSWTDLSEILNDTTKSAQLIHSAYYTHPSCIKRMAQWLARSPDALDETEGDYISRAYELLKETEAQETARHAALMPDTKTDRSQGA